MKTKNYTGGPLSGEWVATIKLDGVRVHYSGDSAVSRSGKPLYNIPRLQEGVYEAFKGTFKATIEIVRSRTTPKSPLTEIDLYQILPNYDSRLILCKLCDPSEPEIRSLFLRAREGGHEGVVLRQGELFIKVKDKITEDVPVLSIVPGKGRLDGMMGALVTPIGNIGTGFTYEDRRSEWEIGEVIEVEGMERLPSGKIRHPRFIRRRPDKSA